MPNLPDITLCEVGLRDGLQNEKVLVRTEDKLALIKSIVESGIKVIEVGSFVHPQKVPQMADTDLVFKHIPQGYGVE
jgi:hydroxymethylglutaryl-CoA lyase